MIDATTMVAVIDDLENVAWPSAGPIRRTRRLGTASI